MTNIKLSADFTEPETKRFRKIYDTLPKPAKYYDLNGLRYPVTALNKVGKQIIFFPLEVMAQFADVVCSTTVDHGDIQKEFYHDVLAATPQWIRAGYRQLNTTSVGNMAYIAWKYPDPFVRDHAIVLLEEIFSTELSKRN